MNRYAIALGLALCPLLSQAEPLITEQQYTQVLQGDWRAPANAARDRYRHPAQTLSFFGLAQGQTVIEITPGNGWYSELLAPLLKSNGQYIAALEQPGSGSEAAQSQALLAQKFAADPAHYSAAKTLTFDPQAPVFGTPGSADLVLTFRNVHNWVVAGTQAKMFKAFYSVLKPGGVLGVVDHRARAGADLTSSNSSGYLPTEYVVQLATAAGFTLQAQSEVNANPADTKDYPAGVWSLPPTYKEGAQSRAKYQAIGESDRFTLRFVKP